MKKIALAVALAALPTLASAQTLPQSQTADATVLQMKVEELNFLLEQRRQQLAMAQAESAALKQASQQKDAYWSAYVKGLEAPKSAPVAEKKP